MKTNMIVTIEFETQGTWSWYGKQENGCNINEIRYNATAYIFGKPVAKTNGDYKPEAAELAGCKKLIRNPA